MTGAPPVPTVVLVHGAFADSSGWNGVIARLFAAGVRAQAVANPLRGIPADTEYVAAALQQVPGPVLAVGHSYGGAVVTNAAARADDVVGLVYVAAFAPDEGELLADVEGGSVDSVLMGALEERSYPTPEGPRTEWVIRADRFHDAFAADLPSAVTAVMAATQRPVSVLGFTVPSGTPAWRTLPSWAVVPTGDRAAGTDVLRAMARRAGADVVETEGSHAVMISQPQVVADVILRALDSLARGVTPPVPAGV
ncbi:alpha/beta hydrolase [Geodermatophilus arenarius]|uniref:Alpha/beta fold hydrolase n=1 Tax=Geodermatophilus arenarius TaxID=1137990 RepID=A0ABV9LJU1_9ACTN